MKIEFFKVKFDKFPFLVEVENLKFEGNLQKLDDRLVSCKAKLYGNLTHSCDRCADDIVLNLDEDINLILSNGVYKKSDSLDVVEFFDQKIDFNFLIQSEIEAIKSDFYYCKNCENL